MATFDRQQNKLCYIMVNVVEAFAVSLVFLLNFMLAPTSNSQTIYEVGRLLKIPNNIQNNVAAVMVYVAER